jgi:hypothetical protein
MGLPSAYRLAYLAPGINQKDPGDRNVEAVLPGEEALQTKTRDS